MPSARSWFALALLIAFVARSTSAQEWPRFRGPNGTGESETNIPAQWGEKDIAWKVALPGFGHGSTVLWGDRIFLMSADKATATRYVLGLDAKDGKQIWRRDYPSKVHKLHPQFSSYACPTPAVDAEAVYIVWSDWEHLVITALDHSGNYLWQRDLGVFVNQHGFGSSPMIYQDLVVVNCSQEPAKDETNKAPKPTESFVVAFEKSTGKERWRLPRQTDTASYSVPCVRKTAGGEELLCCSTKEGMFGIDPKTGRENWSLADAFSMRTVASPVVAGGLVFGSTGSGGGGNYIVAIKPGTNPETAYEIRREANYVPTPVAKGDLIFFWSDAGVVRCVEAATGSELWKERVAGRAYFGSPVRAGDKIFCVDDGGLVVAIAADRTYKELGKTNLKEECRTTPAIAGGKMYVRTVGHLYCIQGEK
jgi:outer membrane protein assembly factor BamB